MTLIDMLRSEQRKQLRRLRYRIANREYMRRVRMLEEHANDNDKLDDVPGAVPALDHLSDLGDPCLRW